MKVSVHSCLLDKECRGHGVPAMTYLTVGRRTVRFNPPYSTRYLRENEATGRLRIGRGWTWRIFQTWKRS